MIEPEAEGLLEARLRALYADLEPTDWIQLEAAASRALAAERAGRAGRGARFPLVSSVPRAIRGPALVGLTAVLLVVLLAAPVWLSNRPGPFASGRPSASPSSSASTAAPPTLPTGIAVDGVGTFGADGMWVRYGAALMISTDAGRTWTARPAPPGEWIAAPYPTPDVFALDASHLWALRSGPDSQTGEVASDFVSLVVYRTTDGGLSWDSSTIPGNFFGSVLDLLFVNERDGYVVARSGVEDEPTTVYRTSDGGVTWTASEPRSLPEDLSASFGALWASANMYCRVCDQPLLQVSHDGGRSWRRVDLPGLERQNAGNSLGVVAAPTFLGASIGFVLVADGRAGNRSTMAFRTDDGGATWQRTTSAPYLLDRLDVVDADHWLSEAALPSGEEGLISTADGGGTWQIVSAQPLPVFRWSFADPARGLGIHDNGADSTPSTSLYLSEDGGRTWHEAG
jgi:photosystem II stability/assembly factor-like uncharacterized protein